MYFHMIDQLNWSDRDFHNKDNLFSWKLESFSDVVTASAVVVAVEWFCAFWNGFARMFYFPVALRVFSSYGQ